jgi:hypothetical protein
MSRSLVPALSVLLLSAPAFAASTLLDCKATDVINSEVFEEALSVEEYPEIAVQRGDKGNLVVSVGGNGDFDQANQDPVQVAVDLPTRKLVQFAYGDTPDLGAFRLVLESKPVKKTKSGRSIWQRTGSLQQKGPKAKQWGDVADVKCKWWDSQIGTNAKASKAK